MRIAPFCTLQNISEFLTYPEALKWLSAANGNAESRLLRQETFLSASAAVEYEYHLADVGALEVEAQNYYDEVRDLVESRDGGRSRREQLEWELRDEQHQRREDEERIRRARFGNGLNFCTARDDDLNYCIWRRWAGED
jgi:hypothetical protein